MFATRTATRTMAAVGAAAALTVAGAGTAMAADTTHAVDGNTLAVTFEKEDILDVAVCFAAVVPTAGAAGVVDQFQGAANGNVADLLDLVTGNSSVTVLYTDELIPNPIPSVAFSSQTVYAELEPNVYTLVSKCTGSDPVVNPAVLVGDPLSAITGSLEMGSSGDTLGAASSLLGGGDAGGDSGSDIGTLLGGGMGDTGSGAGE
ncbi:hypothetical protein [Dietzia sp. ANT_WB102]|uniref:hypothetical protein n=1 Tax=Dietzia sp. ANT_WB102 TaxID=2597345 RepID=UPI0011EF8EBA|nr:hypothetical protein [Dietzia sp. ANT_WB102]KAA0916565.1 hypothetical protein FQ137_15260 [Dietzia sp. ANT_WB102]